MNFSVGQIIYLLTRKDPKVYPALVSEEINKRSLSGESTSYMVKLPTEDTKEIELNKLDAEVFISLDEARDKMIERATGQINLILEKAKSISSVFDEFITSKENSTQSPLDEPEGDNLSDAEYASVDLGNGKVGRIDVSSINKIKEMSQ
jgi:vacuolar-type H+-ATPase subunit I/STV1